jgi:hypothetical protein
VLLATAIVVPLIVAQFAFAGSVTSTLTISKASPFSGCSNQGFETNFLNAEVEPWVVVDPAHHSTVVAAWQQDRWGDPTEGGAHGLVAWSSLAPAATSWAPFTSCSGGTAANNGNYDRASDVWLSYGPDGVVYQSALVFNQLTGRNGVTVSSSADGGKTWSDPAVVDGMSRKSFTHGDDKESITADPYRPGWVYAVWDRYSLQNPIFTDGHGQNANKGPAYFSRSTDGGKTWSAPEAIYARDNGTIANQIVVLPNGTLRDFFTNFIVTNVRGGVTFSEELCEISSSDGGLTWSSEPVVVSPMTPNGAFDPNTLNYIRAADALFDVAVDPASGNLYAVWQDSRFNGIDQVAFSKSTDGGVTWSSPTRIDLTPNSANPLEEQAFTPSVDITANGTIGVTYYNFQNGPGTPTDTPTDYWAVTSGDGGTTWSSELRLTSSSFNAQLAPSSAGVMIGDYEGLTHAADSFIAAYEVTTPTPGNPTDIELTTFNP